MEPAENKMAANELVVSTELKRKGCDPPMKPEGHNILESPTLCVHPSSECPKSSTIVHTVRLEGDSLNRPKMSLGGYGFPCTSPDSTSNPGLRVEELMLRNYKIPDPTLVSSSSTREGMGCGQVQWQHLYQLAGGSQRNPYARQMPLDLHNHKPWLSKEKNQNPDETSLNLIDNYKKIGPSNALPLGDNQSKILSSSSFSQFFINQSMKGKGVVSKSPEISTDFTAAAMGKNKEKQVVLSKIDSDASLKSIDKIEQHSRHSIDRGGLESSLDGINLREWLKPARGEINKFERLHVFRLIVQIVDYAHSQGAVLQDLRPSCLIILPSNRVRYRGLASEKAKRGIMNPDINKKRPLEQEGRVVKQQKLEGDMKFIRLKPRVTARHAISPEALNESENKISGLQHFGFPEPKARNISSYQSTSVQTQQESKSLTVELEKKWYASPEELDGRRYSPANIYGLGVLLFELLCCYESFKVHSAAMLDLRQRILPPNFLLEYPKEAGFCLWMLHPEPSSRPTTSEILKSELICGSEELYSGGDLSSHTDEDDDDESKLLLDFLMSLKEHKQKRASKLLENIGCLEEDTKEVERRHILRMSSDWVDKVLPDAREKGPHPRDHFNTGVHPRAFSVSNMFEPGLMRNMSKFENAYFHKRSQIQPTETNAMERPDKDLLRNRFQIENEEPSMERKPVDCLGGFFEGICKFARYSNFEVRGALRNGDLLNSANVICSLSFDRDEDYIAVAGVSKKIKVFEFASILNETVDIQYPVIEMSNKSKLTSVCWNKYIKNHLASTDYDGVVQMWDAITGQGFSQYIEHQRRAWSVDFSQVDPMKFASGSDDCAVKLWSINEKSSVGTIRSPANVCCVQFSSYSSHLMAFGSADYKIYGYDIRYARIPWCILAGHGKAVSCVKFLDSDTLVSSSIDSTLKLWDLNKTSSEGLSSNACSSTFSGHTNEKNFVGLSVLDGYIACGSETNEVYAYHRSMPMPITSHRFGCVDPISGHKIDDFDGQFVSSVCWREKSNMLVAASSNGSIKLLQMV